MIDFDDSNHRRGLVQSVRELRHAWNRIIYHATRDLPRWWQVAARRTFFLQAHTAIGRDDAPP